jgi:CDP-diglyceride synthetase
MDSRERLHRFDDVFKLSLTLVSIILAFGSKFTELNAGLFALLIAIYVIILFAWSYGHLSSDMSGEVFFKLIGWFFFIVLVPSFFPVFLAIMTKLDLMCSHVLVWVFFGFGNLLYWACFSYLKQSLTNIRLQKLLKFSTFALATFWAVGILMSQLGIVI